MHLSESYLIANCGVTVARMQSVHEVSSDAQRVRAPSAQQKPEQQQFTRTQLRELSRKKRQVKKSLLLWPVELSRSIIEARGVARRHCME